MMTQSSRVDTMSATRWTRHVSFSFFCQGGNKMSRYKFLWILALVIAMTALSFSAVFAQSGWVGPTKNPPPLDGYIEVTVGENFDVNVPPGEYVLWSKDCDSKWLPRQNRHELAHQFKVGDLPWEDTPCVFQEPGGQQPADGLYQWKEITLTTDTRIQFRNQEESGFGHVWFKPTPPPPPSVCTSLTADKTNVMVNVPVTLQLAGENATAYRFVVNGTVLDEGPNK